MMKIGKMNKVKNKLVNFYKLLPINLQYLFSVYLLSICFFSIFRIILTLSEISQLAGTPFYVLLGAFWMGFRFDTVITGYIMIFPFAYTLLLNIIPLKHKAFKHIATIYFSLAYIGAFSLCAADIPYFAYFNSRLSAAIFNWTSTPDIMLGMLLESPKYYPFIAIYFIVCACFIFILFKIAEKWHQEDSARVNPKHWRLKYVPVYLLATMLLFIGIRGRIAYKSPIKWGTAYFSTYPFPNQLGLNPVFTFGRSYLDKLDNKFEYPSFFDDSSAISLSAMHLNADGLADYPLARFVSAKGEPNSYNIVLVVMEAMSSGFLGESGNFSPSLTPFLDSLSRHSWHFTRLYSSGVHTFNGLWSIFLSMPPIPVEGNFMEDTRMMQQFSGIARQLHSIGYASLFSCPHDEQFDNIGGMMSVNGFESILSQKNYLDKDIISPLGVPDHVLFQRTIPEINKLHNSGKPFFTAILTSSNHGPYALPNPYPGDFSPKYKDMILRAVEYSDWSIKYFIQEAQKQTWFENTLFVFVSDHGSKIHPVYEMDINYFHIPLLIYAPKILKEHKRFDNFGSQTDVFPTLMNLMNISYINNTFGIDLFTQQRDYAYFTSDTKLGVIGEKYFMIRQKDGSQALYDYASKSLKDYSKTLPDTVDAMSRFALSQIQASLYLIHNKKAGFIERETAGFANTQTKQKNNN